MVESQINSLTLNPYFGHNLCFKYPNESCEPILDIYVSKYFQWHKELFNIMSFNPPLKSFKKDLKILRDSNSQSESSLGNVWVHSLTLSYTPMSTKCDSRASFLPHTFASLYLGREPKVKVAAKVDHQANAGPTQHHGN